MLLAPLEKWSRPDFLGLLERLQLIFTRALAKKSGSDQVYSNVVTDLAAKCSRQKLYHAAEALTHGVSLLQANGSAGDCGWAYATCDHAVLIYLNRTELPNEQPSGFYHRGSQSSCGNLQ